MDDLPTGATPIVALLATCAVIGGIVAACIVLSFGSVVFQRRQDVRVWRRARWTPLADLAVWLRSVRDAIARLRP